MRQGKRRAARGFHVSWGTHAGYFYTPASQKKQSISYSQNSNTELVRLVVSRMEWFV